PPGELCFDGYHWDPDLETCVPDECPPGYIWDLTLGTCVPGAICDVGYHWDPVLGDCVPDSTCPPGMVWDTELDTCVLLPLCPRGYYWDEQLQACVPFVEYCNFDCITTTCDTTILASYPLPAIELLPVFMQCGFTSQGCTGCDSLGRWTEEFKNIQFPAPGFPQHAAPVRDTVNLTPEQIEMNMLWARFINYRSGMQYGWVDYLRAA